MYQSMSLIGNIGNEPELKVLTSGNSVCNFSVAVSDQYVDKNNEKQQRTEWFNVSAFGKLAEICGKFCHKGKQVFIQGEIRTSKWEDSNGNKRESISLVAQTMKLLGSKGDSPAFCAPVQEPISQPVQRSAFNDSDIPF